MVLELKTRRHKCSHDRTQGVHLTFTHHPRPFVIDYGSSPPRCGPANRDGWPNAGVVTLGEAIAQGDIIGCLADLANSEKSSGNVLSDVVAPYDKIQLHLECFEAPPGCSLTRQLNDIKYGCTLDDPTFRL